MPANTSLMRLAERGDLDQQKQERRNRGRMPMEGLSCNAGHVIDLSPGGACIFRRGLIAWQLGKRTVLVLENGDEKVAVQAEVVRVIKEGLCSRRYGVKFVNLSTQQSALLMQFAKDCRPQLSVAMDAGF